MIDNMPLEQQRKLEGEQTDRQFDVSFANAMARLESYNKHLYRPNSYLHKWWARRCGSTFRLILKHLVQQRSQQDYYAPGGLEGKIILDPMIGGGTTLHEAIRMGANVIGADIDPIPLLQARATLSKVPLEELGKAFNQFYDRLYAELAPFYRTTCPFCASSHEVRHIIYGLRRDCQCQQAIFVDSLILRHHRDGSVIRLMPDTHDVYLDNELIGKADQGNHLPLMERVTKSCYQCNHKFKEDITLPYYQRYVPLAIAGKCKEHGNFFAPPGQQELEAIALANQKRSSLDLDPAEFTVAYGPKSKSLVDRGINTYLDLFSSRQLLYLQAAIKHLADFDHLAQLNLSLLVSTSLEFNSMLCGYKGSHRFRPGSIRHTFARHAYSFPYTSVENNPIFRRRSSGTLQNLFHSRIARGRNWALNPIERRLHEDGAEKVVIEGEVDAGLECDQFTDLQDGTQRFLLLQGSSVSLDLPDDSVDYVVTDPPYFDSVQYSDLATFFHVWLKKLLPHEASWDYELAESAVGEHRNGNGQYTSVLSGIFQECHRVLKKEGRLIFTFHHWNPKGWASLTVALKRAGFILVNRFVVHAENRASVHIANQNALLHDVILILAPRESETIREWEHLSAVSKADSHLFCENCGTIVGWMLNNLQLTEPEIEAKWQSLMN